MCLPGLRVNEFVYGNEGSTVVLSCAPGMEGVHWLKDNRVFVTSLNGKVRLFNVSHTHQGDYTCSNGERTLNYFLVVQSESQCGCVSITL